MLQPTVVSHGFDQLLRNRQGSQTSMDLANVNILLQNIPGQLGVEIKISEMACICT